MAKSPEVVTAVTFLPHESGLVSRPDLGKTYEEMGFGTNTGGTAPTADDEATGNQLFGTELMSDIYNQPVEVTAVLDTVEPFEGFKPTDTIPYQTLTYPKGRKEDGSPVQEWEVGAALLAMDGFKDAHRRLAETFGRKLRLDHHITGMELGNIFSDDFYSDRKNSVRVIRAHSQLRRVVDHEYYRNRYEGKPGSDEFLAIQDAAVLDADIIAVPTDIERDLTIERYSATGIISEADMRRKTQTIGIPQDLSFYFQFSRFNPNHRENLARAGFGSLQELRMFQMANLNAWLGEKVNQSKKQFIGSELTPDDVTAFFIGRLDAEKGMFEWGMSAVDFLKANYKNVMKRRPPKIVMLGGLSQKPGNAELFDLLLGQINELPAHLQECFIIPNAPLPHKQVFALSDLDMHPSHEEAWNRSLKEAQAFGSLAAISPVAGHMGTNNIGIEGKTDTALLIKPGHNMDHYQRVFEALTNLKAYEEIAHAGHEHVKQYGLKPTIHKLMGTIHAAFPGFLEKDGQNRIY